MRSKSFYLAAMVIVIVSIISCAGTNSQIELEKSEIKYSKPQTAKNLFEGKTVEYQLWFDKNKWKVTDPDDPLISDIKETIRKHGGTYYELRHQTWFGMVTIIENPKPASYKDLYEISKRIRYITVLDKDIRTVNNCEVLFIKRERVTNSSNQILLSYFYSNKTGRVDITAATSKKFFAEKESDMFDLLNGLVDPNNY